MPTTETWTIQKLLDWSTDYLTKLGILWPHLEAEILIAHVLKLKRIDLYLKSEQAISTEQLATYKALLLRRKNQEPLAHLTQNQPFMGLDFKITPAVLIPRPETEKMVELILADIGNKPDKINILEIGTGSGCIAVSLAKFSASVSVKTIEIDPEAFAIAKENISKHQVGDRVSVFLADAHKLDFNQIGATPGSFDFLISNPPYIPSAEVLKLEASVKDFEPHLALDGGTDGLDFLRLLAMQSQNWIKPNGKIWIEIGFDQKDAAESIFRQNGIKNILTLGDQNGIPRFLTGQVK
jgi:release factor glutamine methyltransferase